ncbi:MAG TPA: methyltransferase domain-containing protein [Nitrospiraceae bacterium]|nr:methyltransferase domain-containing protein [Nitrospiraceae bacterium]
MARTEYVFHRAEERQELERLRAIEHEFDPASRKRLLAAGVQRGSRCLEVGPGAGSILAWMSEVVGPSGLVCAVDLSTKFLAPDWPPHVDVRQADIRTVSLGEGSFDVVHARYVLIHIPDFEAVLKKMLRWLKPGGWLILEEPDFSASRGITGDGVQLEAVKRVNEAIKIMYDVLKMDYAVGLKLPGLLKVIGLIDLVVENHAPLSHGGSGPAIIMKMSAIQLREKYLATNVVSAADLDAYCRFAEDPHTWAIYYATVAVRARKL